ncbi:MAG: DUF2252 family protein [Acidimicrobiales bacterium]
MVAATAGYEQWLGKHTSLISADLETKHQLMAADAFTFLRGTAYRWAQRWPEVCRSLTDAPAVLAVGDLHVENFGTWRDAEGRLVWGINDVDESTRLAYTSDLVRLVASAIVARSAVGPGDCAAAVLDGYSSHLHARGRPFVLAEDHAFMRDLASRSAKDPARYWAKLTVRRPGDDSHLDPDAVRAATSALPTGTVDASCAHRVAGVGSLGRPRVVAIGTRDGALVAREAKAVVPSAWEWTHDGGDIDQAATMTALTNGAIRACDPLWSAAGGWVVRRLAPDCGRIELTDLPTDRDERKLLRAMGSETANLHLATPEAAPSILADLDHRGPKWLAESAEAMAVDVAADHAAWAHHHRPVQR